jgi:DNA topoisomerase-1
VAHEAIRPTNVLNEPTQIKNLDKDQLRLYTLIWKRTVASQMSHGVIAIVSIDLAAKNNIFHTTGSFIKTPGFISLYMEGMDDQKQEEFDNNLPKLSEGETVELENIIPKQHFTEPPPRFTEASLVKNLEKHDIGRPSTYASIIATLQAREYVEVEQKKFKPTDMGVVVNKFLSKYFNKYVDYDFTANLEDKLDSVARGEAGHLPILEEFWSDFTNTIKTTKENVSREEFTTEKIDEYCPKCKAQLYIKLGRNGKFVGCTNYPECDFTKDLQEQEVETLDRNCPKCESQLQYKILQKN